MDKTRAYRFTGLVVLLLGILFFLRDLGVNIIGETSGWTIVIVLIGAGLLAGEVTLPQPPKSGKNR